MRPTAVHVLIGLLVALLPWLPSCPARIAAADLPPSPPKGGNFSAETRFQEASVAAQSGGGASSNAVLVAEEKSDARPVIPLSESSAAVTNCTGDHCRRTATVELPVNSANNSSSVVPSRPVVIEEDGPVAPRGDDEGPEEGPLPIANQDESRSPPGSNGIEEASRTTSAVHPTSFQRNGTASSNSVTNSTNDVVQFTSNTNKILAATPTGAGNILGRPSGVEGNDVYPSTQGVQFGSELPKMSDTKMAAEGEVSETASVGKVTSTPDPTRRLTVTSMSESGMNSKVHKTTNHKINVVSKVEDDGDDEGHHEDMDDDMEGTEDEDEGSWVGHTGTDGERIMTHGNLHSEYTTGRDGVNLHYKKFTNIEAHDSEEPGTTRSYVVVEKGTKVDYSSSSVVSEVYDSEMPAEEESTKEPSSLQETSESRQNNSVSSLTRLDATESHLHDDDNEDNTEELDDEDVDETEREQNHTTMTSDMEEGRDQEKASGDSSAFTTTIKMEDIKPTDPVPSSTSTKGATEASEPDGESESIRNTTENPTGTSDPTDSTSSVESNTSIPLTSEISSSTQPVTEKTLPASTVAYSPRTSRRLNLVRTSTTESSIKNEVTYHENTTGPIYDFKANISLTTPMVYLMSSTSPTPSSMAQTNGSELMSQSSTTAQPAVSGPTASVTVSTETTSQPANSTEIPDTQVGGNSINDWRIIGDVVDNNSSEETSSQTTISPSASDDFEMTTSSPSVLFTTVKKSDVTELTIENMSMNTTSEQEIMVTEPSSAAVLTHDNRTDVSSGPMDNASQKSNNETMSSSTATPASISSGESMTSSPTNITSTESIPTGDTSSSTSGDLHVYEVDTKVPPVTLVHASDTSASDSSHSSGDTNYTVTVQPISTTVRSNTTVAPEHSTPTPDVSRKIAVGSPEMKITPETTVQHKHTKFEGINSTTKAPEAVSGLEVENEVSFIADPAYVRLWMKISWNEICSKQLQQSLKQALAQLISSSAHSHVPIDRVMLLNFAKSCLGASQEERHSEALSAVHFCILSGIMGSSGKGHEHTRGAEGEERPTTVVHCDAALMQLFLNAWNQTPKPMVEPLIHVQEVDIVNSSFGAGSGMELPGYPPDDDKTGIQAAIGISCIAAVCLLVLATLLIIMRRRQRRFNYGQRCTPVSLDDYSLDSVSVREGNRGGRGQARNGNLGRGVNGLSKGDGLNDWRASKRSYGNPAFEDDDGEEVLLSKPMNFAMLTNAAMDEDGALEDEFRLIPKKFRKRTVRRKSRARYKDPAATAERGEAGMSNKDGDDDDETIPEGAEEKNRYANVVPLPSTRVRLMAKASGPLSTYINANYVRGYQNKEHFYIACQAPLQSTIEDFWRMIWEQQSKVILMLTNLVENGVEKCADYLPPSEVLDCHRLFGDYQVTLKKREVREKYIVSSLQLKDMESNLWREVTHLWFLGWPDQGVPDEPNQIIAFLIEARPYMKTNSGPTVVHCSPGTGRTGTVIAIDISIREFEQSRMVDVPKVVQQLRRDRDGAVQTQQQYTFIYKALCLYATKLTGGAMDSF